MGDIFLQKKFSKLMRRSVEIAVGLNIVPQDLSYLFNFCIGISNILLYNQWGFYYYYIFLKIL